MISRNLLFPKIYLAVNPASAPSDRGGGAQVGNVGFVLSISLMPEDLLSGKSCVCHLFLAKTATLLGYAHFP